MKKNLLIAVLFAALALQSATADAFVSAKTQYRLKQASLGLLSTGMALGCSGIQILTNATLAKSIAEAAAGATAAALVMLPLLVVAPLFTMHATSKMHAVSKEDNKVAQTLLFKQSLLALGVLTLNAASVVGTVKGSQLAYNYFKEAYNAENFKA